MKKSKFIPQKRTKCKCGHYLDDHILAIEYDKTGKARDICRKCTCTKYSPEEVTR